MAKDSILWIETNESTKNSGFIILTELIKIKKPDENDSQ